MEWDSIMNRITTCLLFTTVCVILVPSISCVDDNVDVVTNVPSALAAPPRHQSTISSENVSSTDSEDQLTFISTTTNQPTVFNQTKSDTFHFAQDGARHHTFILFCSVNSIRFWSTECYSSVPLLHHSTRSPLVERGITALSIWRRTTLDPHLVWFDVLEYKLHHALIYRPHLTNCTNLLSIGNNQTLEFSSNPHATAHRNSEENQHKMIVRLAIDNRNNLLFVSNLFQSRIDIYRLDEKTVVDGRVEWIVSLNATSPIDLEVDERARILFWIEDWKQICRLHYNPSDWTTLDKICVGTKDSTFGLQTLSLDRKSRTLYWASSDSLIYQAPYQLSSLEESVIQFNHSHLQISTILGMVYDQNRLYINDYKEAAIVDLESKQVQLVLIESKSIFDLLVLNNNNNHSDDVWIEDATTTPAVQQVIRKYLILNTPLSVMFLMILLILLVYSIVACYHRQHHSCPDCFKCHFAFPCHNLLSVFNLNHLARGFYRPRRSSSDQEGIYSDDDLEDVCVANSVTEDNLPKDQHNPRFFQQNLSHNTSLFSVAPARTAQDDIEDIFGSNHRQPRCLTCRDQEICEDKGVCMATFKVST